MYMPQKIEYPEDKLRTQFYRDHPWELARPRVLVENDGKDCLKYDWSKMPQKGKPLDGERFVWSISPPCPPPPYVPPMSLLTRRQCGATAVMAKGK